MTSALPGQQADCERQEPGHGAAVRAAGSAVTPADGRCLVG